MIEYIVLGGAALVFIGTIGLVCLIALAKLLKGGRVTMPGSPNSLMDLVERHVAEAEAAERKANLSAKLAGLVADPKSPSAGAAAPPVPGASPAPGP
jgi:hypothetical protein